MYRLLVLYFAFISCISYCEQLDPDIKILKALSQKENFIMSTYGIIFFQTENALKFTKFNSTSSWADSTVKSFQKFKEGKHKFSVKIVQSTNNSILVGICKDVFDFKLNFVGSDEISFSFFAKDGHKYTRGQDIPYGVKCGPGDVISVILDLTTSYGTLEFQRNDISMGLAFTDIKQLGNIQFAFSCYDINDIVEVSYQQL